MSKKFNTSIRSEIGELEAVILHTPGSEIENMNPENAERALYSDILNLSVASKEYRQLKGVLSKYSKIYEVKDLLSDILVDVKVKDILIDKICEIEEVEFLRERLHNLSQESLVEQLFDGILMEKNNLTNFLSKDRYSLQPLHNFFFTRDASIGVREKILIGKMKSDVRRRESIIMETIFDYTSHFSTRTINPMSSAGLCKKVTIEGGDVLIASDNILCIGVGPRTSSQGIDYILDHFKSKKKKQHFIIQELPHSPESFIHLDMVFTFLGTDYCMVYEPLILTPNKYQTVHITVDNGKVTSINREQNLLSSLKKLGLDLKPIFCGGQNDVIIQEREQWHSGANFFAIAPNKVIGYERNIHTIEAMSNNGFEVIKADDIINGEKDINDSEKCVVVIEGSELSRGGGGCRCMTMPIKRKPVSWK